MVAAILAAGGGVAQAQPDDNAVLAAALRSALAASGGGPAVVHLQPRAYHLRQPWGIGASTRPIVISGATDGATSLTGSRPYVLRLAGPQDVALAKLSPERRSSVRVIDMNRELLGSLGPSASDYDPRRIGLYEGDLALQPARWPATGFSRAPGVLSADRLAARLTVDPGQASRWVGDAGLWVGGYFGTDYFFEAVEGRATADGVLGLSPLKSKNPVQPKCRYYVYNSLADLAEPGRYVVDVARRRIYLIPTDPKTRSVEIAFAPLLVSLTNAQDVRLDHLALERARGDAVVARNAAHVLLSDDFIGQVGGRGVVFAGGHDDVVQRSVIQDTGDMAVVMDGGDRKTLTPGGHVLSDSIVSRYAQITHTIAGVLTTGVGSKVSGNLITDAPFSAIVYGGNDHLIAGNEMARVVTEVSDFGAIYSGRDWSARGDIIRNNFLHDITPFEGDAILGGHVEVKGVYLDDMLSGQTVVQNVFDHVDQPIYINGGRDNRVFDNVIINPVGPPITIDDRSRTLNQPQMKAALIQALQAVPYDGPLYLQRYPELRDVLTDHPGVPKGNQVARNRIVGDGKIFLRGAAPTLSQVQAGSEEPDHDIRPVHRRAELSSLVYGRRYDPPDTRP